MKPVAELAAYLVAQGMLPMIAGAAPSAPPPAGDRLTDDARAQAGFSGPGISMRYPAADGFVLADLGHDRALVRFACADHEGALRCLTAALEQSLSGDTTAAPAGLAAPGRLQQMFMIRVSDKRYARVTAVWPQSGAAGEPFEITVAGLEAVGHRSGGTAGPAPGLRGPLAGPQAAP